MTEDPPATGPHPGGAAGSGDRHLAPHLLKGHLAVSFTTTTERPQASLKGDIDMGVAGPLHRLLQQALSRSETGLDLNMSGVDFCDSSGLNTLLRLRSEARAEGRTVAITDAGPQLRRLLAVTETADLFAPLPSPCNEAPES
ncbi:STAS domain-containing protein [Kitasatospora sp. NPDC001574]